MCGLAGVQPHLIALLLAWSLSQPKWISNCFTLEGCSHLPLDSVYVKGFKMELGKRLIKVDNPHPPGWKHKLLKRTRSQIFQGFSKNTYSLSQKWVFYLPLALWTCLAKTSFLVQCQQLSFFAMQHSFLLLPLKDLVFTPSGTLFQLLPQNCVPQIAIHYPQIKDFCLMFAS